MGPFRAVGRCYLGILNFAGRARRAEYWWFVLFQFILVIGGSAAYGYYIVTLAQQNPEVLNQLQAASRTGGLGGYPLLDYYGGYIFAAWLILLWLPMLSVSIRRLHDTNRSGGWWFIQIVPIIGPIWFLVLMCLPGTYGNNRFGGDSVPNRKMAPPAHPPLLKNRRVKKHKPWKRPAERPRANTTARTSCLRSRRVSPPRTQ